MDCSLINDTDSFLNFTKSLFSSNISCEELKHKADIYNINKCRNYNGEPVIWKELDRDGYIKIFAYFIIFVGGLFGNVSVILTVALFKSMRNAINIYVVNLATADALICIMCMLPHALTVSVKGRFVLGAFMCKFNPFTQMACLTSSVLTLCAISCDRFMAVFRPFEVRSTERRTGFIIVTIWIVSLAVSTPFLFFRNHAFIEWADFSEPICYEAWPFEWYRDERNRCQQHMPLRKIYYIVITITLFFVPIIIMLVTYLKILIKIWRSKAPGEQHEASIHAKSKSRHKVLKMVFIVLIAFIICWMPFQISVLMGAFQGRVTAENPYTTFQIEFEWFSHFLAYANSFINPFIYGLYNREFRDKFCLILHCKHKKRRTRAAGANAFLQSLRSMTTGLTSLRSRTPPATANMNVKAKTPPAVEMKPIHV